MNVCTVTTRKRTPYAAVLAQSFHEQHPDGSFFALICDTGAGLPEIDIPGARLLVPEQIGLPAQELGRMAMVWPEPLLKRSLVPYLIDFLLTEDPAVLYLADDVQVLAPLMGFEPLIAGAGLLLARRSSAPLPADGRTPGESDLLEAGVHESGMAGISVSAKDCLDHWKSTLRAESLGRVAQVAERIQDLLAAHFPHHVLSGAQAGASFWNAWDPALSVADEKLYFGGELVRLFLFDGYDADTPHLLSRAQGPRPRVLLSENDHLRELARGYCERLIAAGFEKTSRIPYGFEYLPSGVRVDDRMRRLYRRQIRASVEDGAPHPPDPYDPDNGERFLSWLNSPDENGPAPAVSRYLHALYEERGDLQAAFPGIARADVARYLEWVVDYGAAEVDLPEELLPADTSTVWTGAGPAPGPAPAEELSHSSPATSARTAGDDGGEAVVGSRSPFGVNIVGYFRAELGVGEMGRLVLGALEQAAVPYATSVYSASLSRQTHQYAQKGEEFSYDINLFCVNADQLFSVVRDFGTDILDNRYNIGLWWWEADVLPLKMASAADLLDEIWVGSEYVGRAVRKATDRLVRLLPVPIRPIDASPMERSELDLPEGFFFLFTFDFLSIFERKNPVGVVEAFSRAFSAGEGPHLLIKTINGHDHLHDLEKLRMAACGRTDITIYDGYLSGDDKDRLLAACDCYVSLHRAEGYGLGMAEAMALGKPIIATGYSGNLTFLNDSNSILVPYRLVEIPPGAGPYPAGATWAEPDIDEAAGAMRRVVEEPDEARALGARAKTDVLEIHTPERTARFIAGRLDAVRQGRRPPVAAAPSE